MKMLARAALALFACFAALAMGQTPTGASIAAPAGFVPGHAPVYAGPDGKGVVAGFANPLPTWNGYSSATTLSVGGASRAAGRALMATCTAAGTATVTLADGSTASIAFGTGTSLPLPLSVTGVATSSATCSYYSLASALLPTTGPAPVGGVLSLDGTDPNNAVAFL